LNNHIDTIKSEKSLVDETLSSQKAKNDKMEDKLNDLVSEIKKA
jgi:predicted nuclease with TOPRIM domain